MERTINHIMQRWSEAVEKIYGQTEVRDDCLYVYYQYDHYSNRTDWHLPLAVFWNLEEEIQKAKAEKDEKARLAREQKEATARRQSEKHLAYIREEAKRLGIVEGAEA